MTDRTILAMEALRCSRSALEHYSGWLADHTEELGLVNAAIAALEQSLREAPQGEAKHIRVTQVPMTDEMRALLTTTATHIPGAAPAAPMPEAVRDVEMSAGNVTRNICPTCESLARAVMLDQYGTD